MTTQDLKEKIEEYRRMQLEIKELEARLKPIREVLETEAVAHGGEMAVDCFKLKIIECERETVALKEAKECFGSAMDKFLKKSFYTQLRVS